MLDVIKIFISSIILIASFYIYCKIIINEKLKLNKIHLLLLSLVVSILNTMIYQYMEGSLKTIFICLLYTFFVKYVFKQTFSRSIFISIIFIMLTVIPDLLITTGLIYIFGISKEYCYSVFAGSILGNLLVSILKSFLFDLIIAIAMIINIIIINILTIYNNLIILFFSLS